MKTLTQLFLLVAFLCVTALLFVACSKPQNTEGTFVSGARLPSGTDERSYGIGDNAVEIEDLAPPNTRPSSPASSVSASKAEASSAAQPSAESAVTTSGDAATASSKITGDNTVEIGDLDRPDGAQPSSTSSVKTDADGFYNEGR